MEAGWLAVAELLKHELAGGVKVLVEAAKDGDEEGEERLGNRDVGCVHQLAAICARRETEAAEKHVSGRQLQPHAGHFRSTHCSGHAAASP